MLLKSNFGLLLFSILAITSEVFGRENVLERDGRAVYLYPRRFGQEQPAVLQKIRDACGGAVCGNLAGQAVTPLLAAQPECSQQDMADAIIDASKQFDAATASKMVAAAVEYRQVEKNTPPDFTTNPPSLRNSVFCQKVPKNPELNGLVQAQDPANDPDLFFDPALKATVRKGSQPNTAPFGGVAANPPASPQEAAAVLEESPAATDCETAVTVTVTAAAAEPTISDAVTVTAGTPAAAATTAAPPATAATPAGADFGSCTVPEIEFGVGFDNRRETSFRPKDLQSFNHGSAQNIGIITQFICDTLTNSCKANQAAKDVCARAQTAALAATAKTGAQADAFNGVFGITTNFAAVAVVDNTGQVVSGGAAVAAPNTLVATKSAAPATATPAPNVAGNGATGGIGNFGSCTVPEIEFGAGFDGRRETSFQPADKASFNHGSAQNIDIITRSICDTLTNSCQADQTAKDTCARATAAASAATAKTGAQADAFNAVFGISTNFAAVAPIDDQGRVVGAATAPSTQTPPAANNGANNANNNNNSNANNNAGNNNANTGNNGGAAAGGNLQTFTGNLAGVTAPVVTALGGGQFQVTGNAAFNNLRNALVRSCDVQNNQCANAANASGNQNGVTVAACNAQQAQCISQANASAN